MTNFFNFYDKTKLHVPRRWSFKTITKQIDYVQTTHNFLEEKIDEIGL